MEISLGDIHARFITMGYLLQVADKMEKLFPMSIDIEASRVE